MNKWFKGFSDGVADCVGQAWVFAGALGFIAVWAICGPFYGFSDTWQLVINTSTTITTFLLVFLIQSSQNQENKRIHRKLNKLLKKIEELEEDD